MYSYVEPVPFIQGLEDTHHNILFYDSPKNKKKILYNYLIDGLEKNKGVVYVRSESTKESIIEDLKAREVDTKTYLENGQLEILDYDRFYIENDKVEPMRIMSHWISLKENFTVKGYDMRVTGETDCFFKEGKVRDLLKYEYTIRKLPTFPVDILCLYNLSTIVEKGYTDMIMPLVRAHGKAIFASEAGTMVMEPEKVEASDLENLLKINIL
jgi:hypothetical protein